MINSSVKKWERRTQYSGVARTTTLKVKDKNLNKTFYICLNNEYSSQYIIKGKKYMLIKLLSKSMPIYASSSNVYIVNDRYYFFHILQLLEDEKWNSFLLESVLLILFFTGSYNHNSIKDSLNLMAQSKFKADHVGIIYLDSSLILCEFNTKVSVFYS
jgi:hypothetical protein